MGEIKQTNMRLDSDTSARFKQFCDENGMNQAQGFDHIMQVLELNLAKNAIPGRVVEIESFEKLVKGIMSAYINSLEIMTETEARVKEEFSGNLTLKDQTIETLQKQIEDLKKNNEELAAAQKLDEDAKKSAEERAENAVKQMEAAQKLATDKEQINIMLTSQLTEATEKLSGYDALKENADKLKSEINRLQQEVNDQKKQAAYETEKLIALKERELSEALFNAKLEAQESLTKMREEKAVLCYKIQSLQDQLASIQGNKKTEEGLDNE